MAALSNEIGDFLEAQASNLPQWYFICVFTPSLVLQSAGAKVSSHVNFISYTLKVDILCKLAAAPPRHRPSLNLLRV